ncbi:30S ribosomal protein S17 [Candidatus Roizmanbacteria bacterium RIFCSPHIGHO2_02_FULL_40_13b]|uniref:Small ribosomal subunit protein uS17 n=1 Tax=Candidatus Roizmanbacteria bacterium RIFCSPHIGHO2_01_FULL_39_24 TaxID=1802032 RepID=A0A1F7GL90_9BACT|nr:MAG: 30S ribosomal protein S17 [Candidatus Roizmanbacteria bacterium RIFCSPHIGHO2_01_FULL_39_24]OGK27810.1 MAG: 30S ribosomal protein S17 [Candidatus Roizmanbacteria bacterium RIFCSPHIGHO2_02_FULL_40_13b]OGK49952.1 MAG: 30S ribosomal protein S17 [Candidatus Roizmanbacteria bacterium RIFCSPLOWO2_01_FULL_40_32]OGK55957.1 MAG: 30S ribosomal protein S17 [Candidatus Roizmanbacteria bacterium RIFCSPLOWO2_02_FULL_39_8]
MAKKLIGKVVSTKMEKTIVVSIMRSFKQPLYKKVIRKHKKYKAHNEDASIVEGDTVEIIQTRPISKDKHFKVLKKVVAN